MKTPIALLLVASSLDTSHAIAQDRPRSPGASDACIAFNTRVVDQVLNARLIEAEAALTAALASAPGQFGEYCTAVLLQNMAATMERFGRFPEAEAFAAQSVRHLETNYQSDDLAFLRPLQTLGFARLEQGKLAKAREAFEKMRAIPTVLPADRNLVRSAVGSLLSSEGRYEEAATEYLAILTTLNTMDSAPTAEKASVISLLAEVYLLAGRLDLSRQTTDTAIAMLESSAGTAPRDLLMAYNSRGILHARQRNWKLAERDFRKAISVFDPEHSSFPAGFEKVLQNYAIALRKNHHKQEAQSIETRLAGLASHSSPSGVVDITELRSTAGRSGR